ncbi:hypothetical protein [Bradyrhizobium centrolobii]|uniref:hypothetical protein n=1 Tax=Bradyrhizobium centrolobii TaxID=1505087 RepID=UPI0010A97C5C|nr:hypothetical protein [Bradyrhizobium centrolobii]
MAQAHYNGPATWPLAARATNSTQWCLKYWLDSPKSAFNGPKVNQHADAPHPSQTFSRIAEAKKAKTKAAEAKLMMSACGVRRDKAALSSGCKPHPANAPAGSNRSSYGGDEVAEAFG